MTFFERVLLASVAELGGKVYATRGGGTATTNCSRFLGNLLTRLYGNRAQDREVWHRLMVRDPSQPFSPIEAIVEEGWGEATSVPIPGRIAAVQGWRELDARGWVPSSGPTFNGHAFLYWEPPTPEPGSGWVINANTRRPWAIPLTWGEAAGKYQAGVELCALVEP